MLFVIVPAKHVKKIMLTTVMNAMLHILYMDIVLQDYAIIVKILYVKFVMKMIRLNATSA